MEKVLDKMIAGGDQPVGIMTRLPETNGNHMYFSVIITCYKRKDYVFEAINSVIGQNYEGSFEIIVVGDLLDNEIVNMPEKPKIIVLTCYEESLGHKIAKASKTAKGDWIVLLEDDDLFLPTKLNTLFEIVLSRPDASLIKNSAYCVDSEKRRVVPPPNNILLRQMVSPLDFTSNLRIVKENGYYILNPSQSDYFCFLAVLSNNSSLALRREMLKEYVSYIDNYNLSPESLFASLAVLYQGKIIITPSVLTLYRLHADNSSSKIQNYLRSAEDFKIASSLPLPRGLKISLRVISSRLRWAYILSLISSQHYSELRWQFPNFLPDLLYATFGRLDSKSVKSVLSSFKDNVKLLIRRKEA